MTRFLGYIFVSLLLVSCDQDGNESGSALVTIFDKTEMEDFSHLMSDFETETLALINAFRAQANDCGGEYKEPSEPLSWHPNLDNAAEAHAEDMFLHDVLSHEGSDGSSLGDRLIAAGFLASHWGENIARGPRTPAEAVEAFKNSPGHCSVMSSQNFKQVGIAKIGDYWVFDFGRLR